MQVIYGAQQNTDMTEGRGPARVVGWFKDKLVAESVNRGLPGVMGTKNDCSVVQAYLFEHETEYRMMEQDKVKQGALSKLTKEEKKALGL